MSFYRTTFDNCHFRTSFHRTTCEKKQWSNVVLQNDMRTSCFTPSFYAFFLLCLPLFIQFFITISNIFIYFVNPSPRWNGWHFWKKVVLFACRSIERHLKIAIFACRSIERHAKMAISKCRSMERHANRATFFQKMPSISSRRGVHKVYKNTKNLHKKVYKKGVSTVRKKG